MDPLTMIAGGNPVMDDLTPGLIPTSRLRISLKPALLLTPTPAIMPNRATDLRSTPIGPSGALVLKFHTKSFESDEPPALLAPVVIVAVYKVFATRRLDGVKKALAPELDTVPAIAVEP